MKFADILALAKAGYKPGEIKELLDLGEDKTQSDRLCFLARKD